MQAANEQVFSRMLRLNCQGTKFHKINLLVFFKTNLVTGYVFDPRDQICALMNVHDIAPKMLNAIKTVLSQWLGNHMHLQSPVLLTKPFKNVSVYPLVTRPRSDCIFSGNGVTTATCCADDVANVN